MLSVCGKIELLLSLSNGSSNGTENHSVAGSSPADKEWGGER